MEPSTARIWIDGGTHAREWITSATVTFIIETLIRNWEDQPEYIRNKIWYFMPMINPDGYVYSRRISRLWRKNRWNTVGSSKNPCTLNYHGNAPISEMETKAIVNFLEERKPHVVSFLSFHSYGQLLTYPYGHRAARYKYASLLQRLGNQAARNIKEITGRKYRVGSRHSLLILAGGGADDWACSSLGAKYVYTIELRDTGDYVFLLPPRQIIQTAMEGYAMVEAVAKDIG
ncbi:carboxypeptidase B-like [Haematobia irritans]|uniref:carboxypeptidase B-like n=1 Tax=Haematobia irritans TaxID=7368 RepID=UPI003F4F8B77